jgi:Phage tail assembly chaperone protein
MLYSFRGEQPKLLPERIRMPDGSTRTQPISKDDLALAGYRLVEEKPIVSTLQKVEWSGSGWLVFDKSESDLNQEWSKVREIRDQKIKEIEWRYNRYYRHQRLGLTQIDSLENLDAYIQALADITKQENPYNIIWPILQEANINGT